MSGANGGSGPAAAGTKKPATKKPATKKPAAKKPAAKKPAAELARLKTAALNSAAQAAAAEKRAAAAEKRAAAAEKRAAAAEKPPAKGAPWWRLRTGAHPETGMAVPVLGDEALEPGKLHPVEVHIGGSALRASVFGQPGQRPVLHLIFSDPSDSAVQLGQGTATLPGAGVFARKVDPG